MKKVDMEMLRARAVQMAATLGIDHEVVVMDLIAAHARTQSRIVTRNPSTAVSKRFFPDGRVEVSLLAPSFADTIKMQV
jgi:hypothetical protein